MRKGYASRWIITSALAMHSTITWASQWMIIEPAVGSGLQARAVDGIPLACQGGANFTTCPTAAMDLLSLGFSTSEEDALTFAANENGLLVFGALTGNAANPIAQIQEVWLAASAVHTNAPIYKVHREIGGPCAVGGGANFAPPPQNCLYAAQLHGFGAARTH
jgi:hypothetical protein